MERELPREETVDSIKFTHECYGRGVRRVKGRPFVFHFTCVKQPSGEKLCKCPGCQTTFRYVPPKGKTKKETETTKATKETKEG